MDMQRPLDWLNTIVEVTIDGKKQRMKRVHHILWMIKEKNPEAYETIRKTYNRRSREDFLNCCNEAGLTNLIPLEERDITS